VASFSPELFLRVSGRRVTTSPIKGTAPRRPGEESAPMLRASAKDAAENIMIVDLMRNDLSRVAAPGSVTVADLLGLEPHPGVWHLVSTVTAELRPEIDLADLLRATFPPGSVTGAPKHTAVQGIAALEGQIRGVYTGAIGFSSPLAGTELNVAIRTFEITGPTLELGVGGGITVDSVPVREWHECLQKAAPLVSAAGATLGSGLALQPAVIADDLLTGGVFETVLALGPRVLRLAAHLARLDRSCRELYGVGVPDDLAARVQRVVIEAGRGEAAGPAAEDAPPDGVAIRRAVRILAHPGGGGLDFRVTLRDLGSRLVSSALVAGRRSSGSWRHKWADRTELLAAERLADPATTGSPLPYFVDAAGQVTESTRGNIFIRTQDGGWQTAPAEEDLLPGVTRREVLDLLADTGRPVRLTPFTPAALREAPAAFWTSSLSGAVTITAVDGRALGRDVETVTYLNQALGLEPGVSRPAPRR
ncbi:MAG: chorismate-binding protein, partial [Propionibacteriaceae bacterium]